jgi:integrase
MQGITMRLNKPFFRKQTQCWYVQDGKRQRNLGKDAEAAKVKYGEWLATRQPVSRKILVVTLIDRFLTDLKGTAKAPKTYDWYWRHLDHPKTGFKRWILTRHSGELPLDQVAAEHVKAWLKAFYATSGDNNKNGAVRAICRVFNWAAEEYKDIPPNPLGKAKWRAAAHPREGKVAYLKPSDWERILAEISSRPDWQFFLDIIKFLRLTGARPDEACKADCRHFDAENKCLVFERIASKGKRRQRVIQLTGESLEIVKRLTMKHGDGPIFRTIRGKRWTNSGLNSRCDFFRERAKVESFFPYQLRHSFITDMLKKGVEPMTVALWVGHTSIKMIMEVYQHLQLAGEVSGKGNYLRETLERVSAA